MFRLFHDNNIDFLGRKGVFITASVALMFVGLIGVLVNGFNLGVDFAGGTLVRASFLQVPDTDELRAALEKEGVDTSKVIIQPTAGSKGGQGLLIRLSQSESQAAGGIGDEKRTIVRALSTLAPTPGIEPGKVNLNATDAAEIGAELRRLGLDPSVDANVVAARIIEERDAKPSGVFAWDPLESTCRHASLSIL